MKKLIVGIVVLAFSAGASLCCAESGIPNLVGTWSIKAEGGVSTKNGVTAAKTHHNGEFSTLNAELVITKQQGRVFHGTLTSPKATTSFVGIIGKDNKSVYTAGETGFADGKIVSKNKIDAIYRHVSSDDAVAAMSTWTRKK